MNQNINADLHKPGSKDDKSKIQTDLLLDFGLALIAVADLATTGASLYTKGGWLQVPDGFSRYTAALLGHLLKEKYEEKDSDTAIDHAVAVAWNSLARLQLLINEDPEWKKRLLKRKAQMYL